jgi:hypothetical protein
MRKMIKMHLLPRINLMSSHILKSKSLIALMIKFVNLIRKNMRSQDAKVVIINKIKGILYKSSTKFRRIYSGFKRMSLSINKY